MTAKKGYYSLIQFCPNPSRAEAVNVGILLFCPDAGFIAARTSRGNQRATKLLGRRNLDRASLNFAKRSIERRLEVERDSFRTLKDLQRFVNTRANVLILTAPRPLKVFDPQKDIDRLFDELVGGRPRRKTPVPLAPELDTLFHRLEQEGRARLDWKVSVPVLGTELRVPYAFRNGDWNLVKPYRFSAEENGALGAAVRLAVRGDLLRRHGADEEGEKHLVVVSSFAQTEEAEAVEARVEEILHEYHVKTIREGDVSKFASEVEQEAHRTNA